MYKILCFGDSNTYGFNPATGMRFGKNVRWTGLLQTLLGEECEIIEEGCNGRTACGEYADEPWKLGWSSLHAILNSHKPLDLVVLMLGTNDLKDEMALSAEDIAGAIEKYVTEIKSFLMRKQTKPAQVLLIAPIAMGDMSSSPFGYEFSEASIEKSRKLGALYEAVAERTGSMFLNAGNIQPSRIDSLHLDEYGHQKLAHKIAGRILEG